MVNYYVYIFYLVLGSSSHPCLWKAKWSSLHNKLLEGISQFFLEMIELFYLGNLVGNVQVTFPFKNKLLPVILLPMLSLKFNWSLCFVCIVSATVIQASILHFSHTFKSTLMEFAHSVE